MHCCVCCSGHPSPLQPRLPHLLIVLFIYANKDPNSVQAKRRMVPTILRLRGFTQHDIYNPCFWIHCSFCPIVLLGTLHIAAAAASAWAGTNRNGNPAVQAADSPTVGCVALTESLQRCGSCSGLTSDDCVSQQPS